MNVARALVDPPRLLLDEPTAALDSKNPRARARARAATAGRGTAMIAIFHDVEMLPQLTDNVLVLEDGCVMQYGRFARSYIPGYIEAAAAEFA